MAYGVSGETSIGLFNLFGAKQAHAPAPHQAEGAPNTHRRFGVGSAKMFDRDAARDAVELFCTPAGDRGPQWVEAFYACAWNASVSAADPPFFTGPDDLPYYRLNFRRDGETFAPECLSNLASTCLEAGAGAAFFASPDDPDTSPQVVVFMSTLDSLLRYDTHEGDPVDQREILSQDASPPGDRDVQELTASPSSDFLPPYVARALHRYMSQVWGIRNPRVHLMIREDLRPTRNLVIGRKRSDFASDEEVNTAVAYLSWFLPPKRGIVIMPESWRQGDMTPLSDLF